MKLFNQRRSRHTAHLADKRGKNKIRLRKIKLSSKTINGPANLKKEK